jgi:7-cyano-7-deazaguanine synthase
MKLELSSKETSANSASEYQRSPTSNPLALVLFSGGLDSLACLHFYRVLGFDVDALFVDYGQASVRHERAAAHRICESLTIPLRSLIVAPLTFGQGEIIGRNALLLTLGLMVFPGTAGLVSLGIHAGTDYVDCGAAFVARMQSLFDTYTGGRIRIDAPFIRELKGDILRYSRAAGLPTGLTYSCEVGTWPACGECRSCLDVEAIQHAV